MKQHFLFILLTLSSLAYGQDTINKPQPLNFFLDCDYCDFNYIREELPFVSFVRQPQMADVHILVSYSPTASRGRKYFLNFIGLQSFKGVDNEYEVVTSQSSTDDDRRKALLKMLKVGILTYYAKTSMFENINLNIEDSGNRQAEAMVTDRWNYWVIRLSTGAELQKEESQNEFSINSQASARKITEEWKTDISAFYEVNRENYFDDDQKFQNRQDTKQLSGSVIKSLGKKWSVGTMGMYQSRTFLNIKHNLTAGGGIQYNIFPWKECNRRIFAIGYMAGADMYEYNQETIYDRMKETLPLQMLMIEMEYIQPWGEISFRLEGRNYFHDLSKNRLTMETDVSVRLSKNLSFFCDIESQLIHDQLYLPKGDASVEDILLRRRKLATTYEIGGYVGLRFTFGSIYNNIVNERFNLGN